MNEGDISNPSPPPTPPLSDVPDDEMISEACSKVELEDTAPDKSDTKKKSKEISLPKTIKQEYPISGQGYGIFENEFRCDICNSTMNSEYTYRTHLRGKKHKKKVDLLNYTSGDNAVERPRDGNLQHIKVAGGPFVMATREKNVLPKIQNMLNNCLKPLVGLDLVTEIWQSDETKEPVYHCSLCPADCQVQSIISHLIGFKHRMSYIKMMDPALYERLSALSDKKSYVADTVEHYTAGFEKQHGRKKMVVEVEVTPSDGHESDGNSDVSADTNRITLPQAPEYSEAAIQRAEERIANLPDHDRAALLVNLVEDIFQEDAAFQTLTDEQHKSLQQSYNLILKQHLMLKKNSTTADQMENVMTQVLAGNYKAFKELFCITDGKMGCVIAPIVERLIADKEIDLSQGPREQGNRRKNKKT